MSGTLHHYHARRMPPLTVTIALLRLITISLRAHGCECLITMTAFGNFFLDSGLASCIYFCLHDGLAPLFRADA